MRVPFCQRLLRRAASGGGKNSEGARSAVQTAKGQGFHLTPHASLPLRYFLSFTSVNSASTTLLSSFLVPAPSAACSRWPLPAPACACCLACSSPYTFSPSLCAASASAWVFASITALSSLLSDSSASLRAASILPLSSAPSLSPCSFR